MAKVLLKYKEAAVKEIVLDKEITTIGRKQDNDIVIDNQAVSGHHALIKTEGDALLLEDLSSLNGTYLNSQKVSKAELFNGDIILIGVHTLDVQRKLSAPRTKAFRNSWAAFWSLKDQRIKKNMN
jgi:pSer/pThr/pTyr-binding forkhead associated (FHA) protein